jgi:hypothetical protein
MEAPEPTGVLVLRLWIEAGACLRARITCSPELAAERESVVASSLDDILAVVGDFVEDFVSSHSSDR